MTPADRLRQQARALLELAAELDGGEATAPAAQTDKKLTAKQAAGLVGRSQRTILRWLAENQSLGTQDPVSGEWRVSERRLIHHASTSRPDGERGRENGDRGD